MKFSITSILACSAVFGSVLAAPTSLPEAAIEERQVATQLLSVVQGLFTQIQTITTQIGKPLGTTASSRTLLTLAPYRKHSEHPDQDSHCCPETGCR